MSLFSAGGRFFFIKCKRVCNKFVDSLEIFKNKKTSCVKNEGFFEAAASLKIIKIQYFIIESENL